MAKRKTVTSDIRAYRLLAGRHSEGLDKDGSPKLYRKGQVVRSPLDLIKLFGREKFRSLDAEMADETASAEREAEEAEKLETSDVE